ncbi:MAG TPA: hypothetical protein PK095_02820 [Myxococcota bacterium]|nr:hypothetical protein [Myxococcota bacterium]
MSPLRTGLASLVVAVTMTLATGCGQGPPPRHPIFDGPTEIARMQALNLIGPVAKTGFLGSEGLRPMFERVALEDSYQGNREMALQFWLALPPPARPAHEAIDDTFFLRLLAREPNYHISRLATRAYAKLWGDEGLRLLFRRFEECGNNIEISTRCPSLEAGLAQEPKKSMELLMEARDVARSSRFEAEFALSLAGSLFFAEPTLRQDAAVRAWLEGFRTRGETALIRQVATRLLGE